MSSSNSDFVAGSIVGIICTALLATFVCIIITIGISNRTHTVLVPKETPAAMKACDKVYIEFGKLRNPEVIGKGCK